MVPVPEACQPFVGEFFDRLELLDDTEDKLNALTEYERRYGASRGIDILRADLKDIVAALEKELKDRAGGIAECARREGGDYE